MFFRFFKLKPFLEGYLPEKDGHLVFYHVYGNPKGFPILSFHGGPGSRSKTKHAQTFDLKKFKVILFDQRGCGESLPTGETKNNTTQDLLNDSKRLLDFLKIKKVIVSGGSWGSTMALLFAQAYPEIVKKLSVSLIFLARQSDLDWWKDSAIFYPDMMEKIKKEVKKNIPLKDFYGKLVQSSKKSDQKKAVSLYGAYENMLGSLNPQFSKEVPTDKQVQSFKVFSHYECHNFFLKENEILKNIQKIQHIPTLILHNRLDFVCPLNQAYDLHKALPKSKLIIVPESGHGGSLMKKVSKTEIKKFL
ncbi:MAG: alpha/beta fold hydrolase [Alphaproteobacteria bacterium]|nr:alpha/beta fold hydrolase [Alphaproteobacteria bacterium]